LKTIESKRDLDDNTIREKIGFTCSVQVTHKSVDERSKTKSEPKKLNESYTVSPTSRVRCEKWVEGGGCTSDEIPENSVFRGLDVVGDIKEVG